MRLNDEQKVAADRLDEAITGYLRVFDSLEEGQIVTSWVVVAASTCDDEDNTRVSMAHPGGCQPTHIVAGLLEVGRDLLFSPGER